MLFRRSPGGIILDADATVSRRSFLIGGGSAALIIAAPSVVRASSLMNINGKLIAEFFPCDGRELRQDENPDAFRALGDVETARRYGGDADQRTFAMPDFSPFDFGLGARADVRYEVDRQGQLFMSLMPQESMRAAIKEELSPTFSGAQIDTLLSGGRVKM